MRRNARPLQRLAAVAALCLAVVGFPARPQPNLGATAGDRLRILHVDVGQGDATVILGPGAPASGRVMLVDAGDINAGRGGLDGGRRVLAALHKLGVRKLDYVVVTHYHADHVGGLAGGPRLGHSVLLGPDGAPGVAGADDDGDGRADWLDAARRQPDRDEMGQGDDLYRPETVFVDGEGPPKTASRAARSYAALRNPETRHAVRTAADLGSVYPLGGRANATLVAGNGYVWGRDDRIPGVNRPNERSLGIWVSYGAFDYLVCGDLTGQPKRPGDADSANLEGPLSETLVERGIRLEALQVNHHGSANATRPDFIRRLQPLIALISVGNRNPYGHPAPQTLATLTRQGVHVYQTERGVGRPASSVTIAGGHVLIEARRQSFQVRNWGALGRRQFSDQYACRTNGSGTASGGNSGSRP